MSQPTPIPLKSKYLTAHRGKQKSPAGGNNRAARPHRQLTAREIELHAAQPEKVMHMQANGKVRMITVQR